MTRSLDAQIDDLKKAIQAQEALRPLLGDAVVETVVHALKGQLAELEARLLPPPQEQRKLVTVLFADLSGFTAMSEHMDAEDVGAIINALWVRVDAVIQDHGGVIDKHIGDAVVALWGVNSAREDDPEQAIRAALGIQAAVAVINADQELALKPQMRIGINTGPVVLSAVGVRQEFTAVGDTINLASRLEAEAPVGGILISHHTFRHVQGVFDVEPMPPFVVEGRSEQVQAYRVLAVRPRAFRLRSRGVEGIETRMIGRDAQLRMLQTAFYQVLETRLMRVVMVVGEAGLGKSRLLLEFQRWFDLHPAEFWVFQGRGTQSGASLPFSLLRDILAWRFEIQDSDPLPLARQKLENGMRSLLPFDPAIEEKVHYVGHLIGLEFPDSPYLGAGDQDPRHLHERARQALVQLFGAASQDSPILLLLEDLHWADDSSITFLNNLMQACDGLPVLVIGLARRRLYERFPTWCSNLVGVERIDLVPLSEAACNDLINELLQKMQDIPEALRNLMVTNAEGNPYYLEELVKMMIDERVIQPAEGTWGFDPARLQQVSIPQTLTGVLQARLDSLPLAERSALQRASVIGRVFWDDALRALRENNEQAIGETQWSLQHLLRHLLEKDLIYDHPTSAFSGAQEFTFKHTLLREVTYETVLKRQRRRYHAQAAEWLRERSGERVDEFAALVAYHYEQAGETNLAGEWYGRAGLQASEAHAPEMAHEYLQKAVQLTRPARTIWFKALGDVLQFLAHYDQAIEAYREMIRLAQAEGDVLAQARAWIGVSDVHYSQSRNAESFQEAQRAEELARTGGFAGLEEYALAVLRQGLALYPLGDAAGALQAGERALGLSMQMGEGLPAIRMQARSMNLIGIALRMHNRFNEAEDFQERALVLFRRIGARRFISVMLNNLGEGYRLRGNYLVAAQRFEEALKMAREISSRDDELLALSNLGAAQVGQGEFARAEGNLRQVLELAGPAGWFAISETYCSLAQALLGQDQARDALLFAHQALETAESANNIEQRGNALRLLGVCGLYLPDLQLPDWTPERCFAESLQIFRSLGRPAEVGRTLYEWARLARHNGQHDLAQARLQQALALFDELALSQEIARTQSLLASLN